MFFINRKFYKELKIKMKSFLIVLSLIMTTQALADVKGLVCVDNDNYYIFYLIDVDREKISYTNQSQEAWSSTKLVKSSLTIFFIDEISVSKISPTYPKSEDFFDACSVIPERRSYDPDAARSL